MNDIINFLNSVYKCPSRFLFGTPCPLCGMTRAVISALSGDFADAFYYHPLWPLTVITAVILLAHYIKVIHLSPRFIDRSAMAIAAALIICFIIRHILGSPIVAVNAGEGIISSLFLNN